MKEEDEIKRICGNKNPFSVPEGYFEDFTKQLMDNLPQQETASPVETKVTTWQRIKPWFYMAAMFAMVFGFKLIFGGDTKPDEPALLTDNDPTASTYTDEYIEAVIDNSMMDDYTIYCYLTEADDNN